MDAAVLRDRLPEATQKPLFGPATALFSTPAFSELCGKCLQERFLDAVTVTVLTGGAF